MKAFFLAIAIAAAAIFAASQHSLELTVAAAALSSLLLLLLWILRRNIEIVAPEPAIARFQSVSSSDQILSTSPVESSTETFSGLDHSVFARFRENLALNEKQSSSLSPAAEPEEATAQEVVSLRNSAPSAEVKRPTQADGFAQALAQAEATPSAPRDKVTLRRQPTTSERPASQTLKRDLHAASVQALSKQRFAQTAKVPDNTEDLFSDAYIPLPHQSQEAAPVNEDLYDEGLGRTLGLSASPDETRDEAEALLQMARSFARARNWQEAKVSLDNHLLLLQELKRTPRPEDLQLYVQALVELGEIRQAARHLEGVRRQTEGLEGDGLARMVREVVEGLEREQAWETMIPLVQDLLNYARQQLDRTEMDRLYHKLELALEETNDEERLIRTCRSHLEIKRALGDSEGEELLLRKLGRLHHRRGEKELAHQFYQDTVRLRSNVERAAF